MVTYSGIKSSYIAGYYVERGKKRALRPHKWVDSFSLVGVFSWPMMYHHNYISSPDDVKSQREDIRRIFKELDEAGFLLNLHEEDIAEVNKDDKIKVLLERREVTEFYKIHPTSGFVMVPFIGCFELFLQLFRGLKGVEYVKSELAYKINVEDSPNEELIGRGLATLLNEKYGFKRR